VLTGGADRRESVLYRPTKPHVIAHSARARRPVRGRSGAKVRPAPAGVALPESVRLPGPSGDGRGPRWDTSRQDPSGGRIPSSRRRPLPSARRYPSAGPVARSHDVQLQPAASVIAHGLHVWLSRPRWRSSRRSAAIGSLMALIICRSRRELHRPRWPAATGDTRSWAGKGIATRVRADAPVPIDICNAQPWNDPRSPGARPILRRERNARCGPGVVTFASPVYVVGR
jgi:hypothetical protein